MQKLWNELWKVYRADHPRIESEEEKRLIARLDEYEAAQDGFSAEQKELVQRIEDCWAERCIIEEREAFYDGVRFAAMLWNEVFSGEGKGV